MVVSVARERYVGRIQTQTRLWMNVYNGDDKALTVTVKSPGGPDYHKYLAATLRDVRSLQIPEPVGFLLGCNMHAHLEYFTHGVSFAFVSPWTKCWFRM